MVTPIHSNLDIDALGGFYRQNFGGAVTERHSIGRTQSAQKKDTLKDGGKSIGSIKCVDESLGDVSHGKGTQESISAVSPVKNRNFIKVTMTSMDNLPAKERGEELESQAFNEKTMQDQQAQRAKKWFNEVNTTNFYQRAVRQFFPSHGSL